MAKSMRVNRNKKYSKKRTNNKATSRKSARRPSKGKSRRNNRRNLRGGMRGGAGGTGDGETGNPAAGGDEAAPGRAGAVNPAAPAAGNPAAAGVNPAAPAGVNPAAQGTVNSGGPYSRFSKPAANGPGFNPVYENEQGPQEQQALYNQVNPVNLEQGERNGGIEAANTVEVVNADPIQQKGRAPKLEFKMVQGQGKREEAAKSRRDAVPIRGIPLAEEALSGLSNPSYDLRSPPPPDTNAKRRKSSKLLKENKATETKGGTYVLVKKDGNNFYAKVISEKEICDKLK